MPRNPWIARSLLGCLVVALFVLVLNLARAPESAPAPEATLAEAEPEIVAAAAAPVVAEPTPEPTAVPTVAPTATRGPSKTLSITGAMQTVPTEPFLIGNTLGRGMSLRRAPTSADLVRAWPDGTVLEGLGAQQEARGWTWAFVRDPEGNDGWIPTQFLVRSLGEAPAPLPLTPAPPEIPGRTTAAAPVTAAADAPPAPAKPAGQPVAPSIVVPNVVPPALPASLTGAASQGTSTRGLTGLR